MSTPAPGRKLSTADLATPEGRPDVEQRADIRSEALEPPDARQEARRVLDDAGQPVPPQPPQHQPAMRTDTTRNRTADEEEVSPLFADDACHALWQRWDHVQAGFVDEPRRAVQDADSLVAETMQQLANTFARERGNLEQQWGRGDDVSTEDLRIALRRYRSFFKRLLSV